MRNDKEEKRWIVLVQLSTGHEYILDNRIFKSQEDAIAANEQAGWPGTSYELVWQGKTN